MSFLFVALKLYIQAQKAEENFFLDQKNFFVYELSAKSENFYNELHFFFRKRNEAKKNAAQWSHHATRDAARAHVRVRPHLIDFTNTL